MKSNHLGNVLSVITDQKLPVVDATVVVSYSAVVVTATDYSPFGVGLYGRSWSGDYRYGFNGMEKMSASDDIYLTYFRLMSPLLANWMSCDPEGASYPDWSPYSLMGNSPLQYTDVNGDKIKGSIRVHVDIWRFERQARRAARTAAINGNLITAQSLRNQVNDLRGMRNSPTIYHIIRTDFNSYPDNIEAREGAFRISVDPSKNKDDGYVSIEITKFNLNLALAQAVTVSGLIESEDWSIANSSSLGPNGGYLEDQSDWRQILTAKETWNSNVVGDQQLLSSVNQLMSNPNIQALDTNSRNATTRVPASEMPHGKMDTDQPNPGAYTYGDKAGTTLTDYFKSNGEWSSPEKRE
jgi:RHS repeat-associated protein